MKIPSRHEREFLLFVILLGTGGVAIMRLTGDAWHAVGEALLIAAALALTVDRYAKQRLRAEIAEDVFFAALGIYLPDKIKDEMLAIGDFKLVREKMEIRYTLGYHSRADLITCKIAIDFDMVNLTGSEQQFVHQLSIADAPAGATNVTPPILSVKGDLSDRPLYALDAKNVVVTNSVHGRDWQQPVKIPAKQKAHFSSVTQHVLPAEFEDPTIFVEPTIGVAVYVESPPDIHCDVIFDHRLAATAKHDDKYSWSIEAAFLPNTVTRTIWKKDTIRAETPVGIASPPSKGLTESSTVASP